MKHLLPLLLLLSCGQARQSNSKPEHTTGIDSSIIWKGKERIPTMYYFDNEKLKGWIIDTRSGDTVSFSGCHGTELSRAWHSHDKIIAKDSSPQVFVVITGGVYCCDTVRTFNHTAVVKSILDTAGNLTGFEIVKVLK